MRQREQRESGLYPRVVGILTLAIVVSMAMAGIWLTGHLRGLEIRSASEMAQGYFELLTASAIEAGEAPVALAPVPDALAGTPIPFGEVETIVIWHPDGTILHSADPALIGQRFRNDSLARAAREGLVWDIAHKRSDGGTPAAAALLELYIPLHRDAAGAPRLIGEIYIDATALFERQRGVTAAVWASIALVTAVMLAALWLTLSWAGRVIRRQRAELDDRLAHSRRLLAVNRALRDEADAAREDLVRGNEELLHSLGADLHDGPLQMLAAAALSLDDRQGDPTRQLLVRTIGELRSLSSGFSLPELAGLSVEETVRLAAARHEAMTGVGVRLDLPPGLPDLDPAGRICLFRIVQEGLNNAFKHSADRAPVVRLRRRGGMLTVAVCNRDGAAPDGAPASGLGLRGIRRRISALGGRLRLWHPGAAARTLLVARLPLSRAGDEGSLQPAARPA